MGLLKGPSREARATGPGGPLWLEFASRMGNIAGLWSETAAGVRVTPETALSLTAVFSCITRIAEDVAACPVYPYRLLPGGGKELAKDHPTWDLVAETPDGDMDASEWARYSTMRALGWGEHLARIVFRGGRPVRLVDFEPGDRPVARRRLDDNRVYYEHRSGTYTPAEILHIKFFSFDGLRGLSPIHLCRLAVGLGMSIELFGASFYGNSSLPSGFFRYPGEFGDDEAKNFRESFEQTHRGPANAFRFAILEEGMEWVPADLKLVNPNDAQFILSRQFQLEEVCRIFHVPLHKAGSLKDAHYDNMDISDLDYLKSTLNPWFVRRDREFRRKFLTADERRAMEFGHDVGGLLKADRRTMAEVNERLFRMGAKSPNEVRGDLGLNPLAEGSGGDKRFVPWNMQELSRAGVDPPAPNAGAMDNADTTGGSDGKAAKDGK